MFALYRYYNFPVKGEAREIAQYIKSKKTLYDTVSTSLKNIFPSDYFQKPSFYNSCRIVTYVISMRCVKICLAFFA